MKYIMSFENHSNTLTLYRGTDYNIPLYKGMSNLIFLSESKYFAQDYGKNLKHARQSILLSAWDLE